MKKWILAFALFALPLSLSPRAQSNDAVVGAHPG